MAAELRCVKLEKKIRLLKWQLRQQTAQTEVQLRQQKAETEVQVKQVRDRMQGELDGMVNQARVAIDGWLAGHKRSRDESDARIAELEASLRKSSTHIRMLEFHLNPRLSPEMEAYIKQQFHPVSQPPPFPPQA
jgi:hypothetical protein